MLLLLALALSSPPVKQCSVRAVTDSQISAFGPWIDCKEAERQMAQFDAPNTWVWIDERSRVHGKWKFPIQHTKPEYIFGPLKFNRYS